LKSEHLAHTSAFRRLEMIRLPKVVHPMKTVHVEAANNVNGRCVLRLKRYLQSGFYSCG
jgi:hypothetical protein